MTTCRSCGVKTLLAGWEWCDPCAERLAVTNISMGDLVDTIVQLDQSGVLEADRQALWTKFGIRKRQIEAAQELVEERYRAARLSRQRYRGW
jgi:hypothetical protein